MDPRRAEVLSSDVPESRRPSIGAVIVVLLVAALVGAIIAATRYHGEAARLRREVRSIPTRVTASPAMPTVTSTTVALPSDGSLVGEVTFFASYPATGLGQIVLNARIRGGRPHTEYDLVGNSCLGNAADRSWAGGITDANGSAELTGHAWTVSMSDHYWLTVSPSSSNPAPGLGGDFALADGISAFPPGHPPCEPAAAEPSR